MGLDISVYKVVPVQTGYEQHVEHFYTLKGNKELAPIFGKLAFKRKNEYYNVPQAIKDAGYEAKQLECTGMEFGKKAKWFFYNKKNVLYPAKKWLDKVWSNTYFDSISELKESDYFKQFETKFKSILTQNGWKEKYKFYVSGQKKYQYNLVDAHNFCVDAAMVVIKNPPLISKFEKCISLEEVGYQRKGANSQFYEDGMWDYKCITELSVLKEHWKKYFSKPTPDSEGGWGSGVELDLAAKEMKKRFKENIIDKFVEGETFVIYH